MFRSITRTERRQGGKMSGKVALTLFVTVNSPPIEILAPRLLGGSGQEGAEQ